MEFTELSNGLENLKALEKAKAMDIICKRIDEMTSNEEIGRIFKDVSEWAVVWCKS